jgi:prefoldin subunit 5
MFAFIALSGIAFVYIVYRNLNKNSSNSLDKKINYYDNRRDDIDEDIEDHLRKIEELKEERKRIDNKMATLLTKKIISFHKDHQKFNEKSVKKIKHLINVYGEGNKDIEDKIYSSIDTYIDVKQVKDCVVEDYTSEISSSEIDDLSSDEQLDEINDSSDSIDEIVNEIKDEIVVKDVIDSKDEIKDEVVVKDVIDSGVNNEGDIKDRPIRLC